MRTYRNHTSSPDAAPRARVRTRAAAVAAFALVLTGCASLSGGGTVAPGGDTSEETTSPPPTADPSAPLLQIEHKGGFVMMGYDFASVPELTVYSDGLAINHGPQIAIYPGPALPNLLTQELSEEDIDALVTAARDTGLLSEIDYGQPPIADAPTTYVTLTVDGETYVHAAESLGVTNGATEDRGDGEALPGDEMDYGLSEEQAAARAALSDFITEANEIVGLTGEGDPYDIPAFAVMARPAQQTADAAPGEGDVVPQVVPWPLDVPLADAEECAVVDGDAAATLEETLVDANSITQFEQDGVTYDVWFRPLLPHEETCADIG